MVSHINNLGKKGKDYLIVNHEGFSDSCDICYYYRKGKISLKDMAKTDIYRMYTILLKSS